jgi:diguanylate cyclase (GGDEF)-like protein/PAS domain S-box-containing protein
MGNVLQRTERLGDGVNVLLVTADPAQAGAIETALSRDPAASFQVQWVSRLPADVEWLGNGTVDVVLLDLLLPDVEGIGALDTLLLAGPHVPILVFTSAGDEDLARQAVQRGAQDYLMSNHLDSYSLPRALRNVIDRKSAEEALFLEKERAQVTLDSIGDAVVTTDIAGNVTYLNAVAERMSGWSRAEARGKPVADVLRVVDATTHEPPVRNPMALAIEQDRVVGLAANSVLVRRDGFQAAIEDSAAPIHGRDGRVIGAVMVFHDVSVSRAVALKMSHLAQHDFLTDLPNPVLLNDRMSQAIALVRRHRKRLAVLFVDLDHFKRVNDSLGHAAGDKLLQSVAVRLTACVRSSDAVSRRGGDEFVVLLSEITHSDQAARCAEKILRALSAAHDVGGQEVRITASVGISVYPEDGLDPDALLKSADAAMYEAKKTGRSRYLFSAPNGRATG